MAGDNALGVGRIPPDLELAPDRGTYAQDPVTCQLLALLKLLAGFSDTRFHNDAIWLLWQAAYAQARGGALYIQARPGAPKVPFPLIGYPVALPPAFPEL